jgi:hypothetical protein
VHALEESYQPDIADGARKKYQRQTEYRCFENGFW